RYIYAMLSSRTFREYLTEISKGMGSNIKNLNDSIGEFKFPFPPFKIQEKIAEELSLIDDAVDFEEKKEKILDKYLK
ncbi:MAG: restriction endonuclease subunit S, partial [Clostridia bacterium]|nr:restriction endonuclease subunit S [Clostridia bacterium]